MKATELREKSKQELNDMLTELGREQFNMRMQLGTGQLSKTDSIKKVRRGIARVQTVLTEMAAAES